MRLNVRLYHPFSLVSRFVNRENAPVREHFERLYTVQSITSRNNTSSKTTAIDIKNKLNEQPTCAFAAATIGLAVINKGLNEDLDALNPTTNLTTEQPQQPDATTPLPKPEDMTDYRLPRNVIPEAYELTLYPDLDTGLYAGVIAIAANVEESTDTIKVHSNGLTIDKVAVDGFACAWEEDKKHELLVITTTDGPVPTGKRGITIEYRGDMRNRIVGLYVSSYTAEDGNKRPMATTKFEPTFARQAFPCFDEPNMKAKYTVNIFKPKDKSYIALSNMPQADETIQDDGVMVHFEESVYMSTYLACFIVCDFNYTEEVIVDNITLRVYATPAQVEKTHYARKIGREVIKYFSNYFGIKFPLPKLDMAAIPDFVSGAMEHWGLVTYRETALLYDESMSSTANKQRVATVVSHELAHSWFGNLVTMDWWNDLWLNEGFASYIEYKGVHAAEPTWQMMDQFLIDDLHSVLVLDATLGSHPIIQTVTTPDQITEIFDSISYNKGAAILRMLENAVGDSLFQEGVSKYLSKYAYGNAVTDDLLNELQKIYDDKLDIKEFMKTWTVQMGYPIIDVKTESDKFVLTQKRYLTDSTKAGDAAYSPYDYKWTIPVTYITSDKSEPQLVWFNNTNDKITIDKPKSAEWIKFNPGQVGYYRVNYERPHWNTLISKIKDLAIIDRTHLIEETFRIAESGQLSYEVPLELTKYLKEEDNYVPWSAAHTMLNQLEHYLSNSEFYTQYKQYIISIVSPAVEKITWTENDADSHLKRRARVTVLDLACSAGHKQCLDEAKQRFQDWLSKKKQVSQDLRTVVYNYGMAASGSEYWHKLWTIFAEEKDANEKAKLMKALTCTTDPSLLIRLIELAKDEKYIRSQDYFTCLQSIAANPVGTPIVWDYVRENWMALVDRFTLNERYLGRMIPSITSTFSTTVKLEEMKAFFTKYPEAGAGAASRIQALENVSNNIRWLKENKEKVETWIIANTP